MNYQEQLPNYLHYIEMKGWSAQHTQQWYVFEKAYAEESYEIVLPKKKAPDAERYLQQTIGILAGFADESEDLTAERVRYVRKDLLKVRNLLTSEELSVSLDGASAQIDSIKKLVADAAASDRSPRPFREGRYPSISNKMKTHYRFGHTFAGSFGYRIESEVVREEEQLVFTNGDGFEAIAPIERRVMARVVQGLIHAQRAVDSRSIAPLVDGYMDGFSANMCKELKRVALNGSAPVEFRVLWSPKLAIDDQLLIPDGITITEDHTHYIDSAMDDLRAVKPRRVTIEGHIEVVSTKDDPRSADAIRFAVIRWENGDDGQEKVARVILSLSKDDYDLAIIAQKEWKRMRVTGTLQEVGGKRKLYDLEAFCVAN